MSKSLRMNFLTDFQRSIIILVVIYGTMIEAQEADCEIKPTDVKKVEVLVYTNGETDFDIFWLSRYCSWKRAGFPYDQYAPVTIKVGGGIICDSNNTCNCPNKSSFEADCTPTFYHVCAEQILGQEKYQKLLCDAVVFVNERTQERIGVPKCVDKQPGLADKISACMQKQGSGSPQETALKNAAEVPEKGVDLEFNTEPFFFYNGVFDQCISDDSPGWFVQKICAMLKFDIAKKIDRCVEAMAW